jgi:hypothetical protein
MVLNRSHDGTYRLKHQLSDLLTFSLLLLAQSITRRQCLRHELVIIESHDEDR